MGLLAGGQDSGGAGSSKRGRAHCRNGEKMNPAIGFRRAAHLRSILRSSPSPLLERLLEEREIHLQIAGRLGVIKCSTQIPSLGSGLQGARKTCWGGPHAKA